MIKAVDTLVPQEVPPGSGEKAVGTRRRSNRRRGGRGGRIPRISRGMALTRISNCHREDHPSPVHPGMGAASAPKMLQQSV